MKRTLIISIIAAAVLAVPSHATAPAAKSEISISAAPAKTETVVFDTKMSCNNCVKKIKENISFEKGVKGLEVSLEKQKITVTYDPAKTNPEKLAAAIKKLGYKAEKSK